MRADIGTPPRARERAPYDEKWSFDLKLSQNERFKYDPKDPGAWLKKLRNHFIGCCPDAELLLDWAVSFGTRPVTQAEVRDCGLAIDANPVQVSQRLWSWLQWPLQGAGTIELDYNNVEM